MDVSAFLDGFGVVTEPTNLLYCLAGVIIGMLIGVLPGLGPAATMAILLPIAYDAVDPVSAIIMLAGIYYGAQYGGTITSVLLRLPGEASLGGDRLRRLRARQAGQGRHRARHRRHRLLRRRHRLDHRADPARPDRRRLRPRLRPPEYAALALLGVLLVATIGNGNTIKALVAAAVGLLLATVGSRQLHQRQPLHLRHPPARRAASTSSSSPWACSASARSSTTSRSATGSRTCPPRSPTSGPRARTSSRPPPRSRRGSVIGFFLGVLPGGGAVMACLAAYAAEKRVAKDPSRFGRGAIEGVAGPESANNAAATSSFIPLLTIGIPANASMAMLFAALLVVGVQPGPQLIDERPDDVLGRHQLDVHRQPDPAGAEHPAGRHVREDPPGPAGDPRADHRADHDPRRLHDQQLGLRHLRDDRLRHPRLPDEEDRLRARPAGAGLRARIAPGVELPPLDADLRRRPDRLRHPTHLRDDPRLPRARARAAADQAGRRGAVPPRPPPPRTTDQEAGVR